MHYNRNRHPNTISLILRLSMISLLSLCLFTTQGHSIRILKHAVPIPVNPGMRFDDNVNESSDWGYLNSAVLFQLSDQQKGTYHFGYDTGNEPYKSFREEKRDASGRVTGSYGYVMPNGILHVVEYEADERGYRSKVSNHVLVDTSEIQLIGPIPKPSLRANRQN